MVPLEMKGMIRYCHPPTPLVGLHRQSCCPIKTKESYDKARAERDAACFPSMLHQMVSRFKAYRALRRLYSQAIHSILSKGLFCQYLTHYTMEYLTFERYESVPYIYSPHSIRFELKTLQHRFVQMSGRLVLLGYSNLVLPHIEDFEYEVYLSLCSPKKHSAITALYQECQRKGIQEKWRILSHIEDFEYDIPCSDEHWESICNKKTVDIYLDKCLSLNALSATEIVLLYEWFHYLKYPMH